MVWLFPMLAIIGMGLLYLAVLLDSDARSSTSTEPVDWREFLMLAWVIPNNPFGRGLMLAFAAVVFAGENQWNTWKSIVPRSSRVRLILVKYLMVCYFVLFSFVITSLIILSGALFLGVLVNLSFEPGLNGDVLGGVFEDYGLQMLMALISMIIAAGYSAVAAMVTRSIMGGAIAGIIITVGETLIFLPLSLIAWLLNAPNIMQIYRFLPFYNLLNMTSWLFDKTATTIEIADKTYVDSLGFSMSVLGIWVVCLISLTVYLFQQQDITN
jgi:hypothetical protein